MAFVIVALSRGHARGQRQNRLSAVQRLYLALFINAQHNRSLGRIQIQTNYVSHLFNKLRVCGELKVLHSVRL